MENSRLTLRLGDRRSRTDASWAIDEAAITATVNHEQRNAVGNALSADERRRDESHYNQPEFQRVRNRPQMPPAAPLVDRLRLRRQIQTALLSTTPAVEVQAVEAPAAEVPEGPLALSRAWFGNLQNDLEQWDRLPCPASTTDRANYVLARDGRGAALLTLVLIAALITMLVRAFV